MLEERLQDDDSDFVLDANVYNSRGIAKLQLGQVDEAILDFDQAVRISTMFAPAYMNRGQAYSDLGLHRRAIQDLDEAIRLRWSCERCYGSDVTGSRQGGGTFSMDRTGVDANYRLYDDAVGASGDPSGLNFDSNTVYDFRA